MASVKIVLRKEKKKKDGTYPLAIRIIKDRKPKYVHTDQSIELKHWDASERRVKKSHPNSSRLNNFLLSKLKEANDIALEMESDDSSTSSKGIKKKISKKGRKVSFFQFGAERVKGKHLSNVFSVARAERSILCNIEEFVNLKSSTPLDKAKEEIKQRRKQRISESRKPGYSFIAKIKLLANNKSLFFEDINTTFINQYKVFCVSYLDMKPRTITNQLIFIRTLFNEAIAEGLVAAKHYPFAGEKEKIRIGSGHKIGLTVEEVERIENLTLEANTQIWHAKNVWLVAYYFAGIRITDVLNLTWGDFKDGRLFYTMGKNKKTVSLKTPKKAQDILQNYQSPKTRKKDFVFPYMNKADKSSSEDLFVKSRNATSLINDYLKKIASLCSIEKDLSNHIARHTFGNIAGDRIHPLMLQKLYRHSDLKTTINYQANFIHKEADEALDMVIGSE
ncbi:site-specific integrase [Reichenbachiella ulvae]|uniref:Site-specific integrase n=1 Tax=Reichenbachiella ulvae TaxID=2980104 RepID=A0ABT3CP11_9BACT|nr:site-specific integrase [Reichenbachiella ulvae]MCV9385306.1 site-specific integrase [Reichenbachiella ulvae]